MSSRGRSPSPRPLGDRDADIDMDRSPTQDKPLAKVVIVTNLSRNVVESHLRSIFGFYGDISKIDLPLFGKSGQNRGKAALEFATSTAAHKAASHMDGGQLDGAVLKVELSDLPIRSPSRSPRFGRNGRDVTVFAISDSITFSVPSTARQTRGKETFSELRAWRNGLWSRKDQVKEQLYILQPFTQF
ncbi:hypothetical protein ACEPAI_6146 [Sanghuangporus weigelae]